MSRLQVGGLALIIKGRVDNRNVGKQVVLKQRVGEFHGIHNCWEVYCEDGLLMEFDYSVKEAFVEEYRLMPLGDKKTQHELAKELENDTTVSNTL